MSPDQLLDAVVLGLVEGATEFIPVSSTGHLIIAGRMAGPDRRAGQDLRHLHPARRHPRHRLALPGRGSPRPSSPRGPMPGAARLLVNLAIAFLPAAMVGFLVHDWIKERLFNPVVVAVALVVGGMIILLVERWKPPTRTRRGRRHHAADGARDRPRPGALARAGHLPLRRHHHGRLRCWASRGPRPPSSRSSSPSRSCSPRRCTIFSRAWTRCRRRTRPSSPSGFLVAFVSALVVVKAFLTFVSRHSFVAFAWYRIVFGLAVLYWATR